MPDFIIVGAAKAATTSLHHYLGQHPQVQMSRDRWTRFFHIDGGRPDFDQLEQDFGSRLRRESEWRFQMMCHSKIPHNFEDYQRQWAEDAAGEIYGESSPTYLYHPRAIVRIHERFPAVKIIIILRQPADRAYSHFIMDIKTGWIQDRSFIQALQREPIAVNDFWWGARHYFRQSIYAPRVAQLLQQFGREKVKILLYDDILAAPESVLRDIFHFIDVDGEYPVDVSERHNEGILEKKAGDGSGTTRFRPTPLSPGLRRALTAKYRDDIARLEPLIDRDLGAWLN